MSKKEDDRAETAGVPDEADEAPDTTAIDAAVPAIPDTVV